ncbi:hypothetical protein [Nocardiopsis sp. MG754419]|uniref:hypothetical protein n=1 Tax=Nocardiopsis sp. MG754419 TaxID=2259865 RepID=UPI001BA6636E|nr:hypothetical protein [Nocardiopsis sp. MG754419]MBR8741449.1 hypothetical protein [Nocardiopsis sp. MG754419]
MSSLLFSMVPLTQAMPRPTPRTHAVMAALESVLLDTGYTPQVHVGEWSIDARLYQDRHWEHGRPIGHHPLYAVALRLHQHHPDQLGWLAEYPARTPTEWPMPPSAKSLRRLAFLGDVCRPVHVQDLGLVDHLTGRPGSR